MSYCCAEFERAVEDDAIVNEEDDGASEWYVAGCCGTGCYLLSLHHCPFCGAKL